jgi:hypothetical protein
VVTEAELDAVEVEPPDHLLDDREDVVPHLRKSEVQGRGKLVVGAWRGLLQEPLGIARQEAGAGPDTLLDRDMAVIVVDSNPSQKLHAASVSLIDEHRQRLHSRVQERK